MKSLARGHMLGSGRAGLQIQILQLRGQALNFSTGHLTLEQCGGGWAGGYGHWTPRHSQKSACDFTVDLHVCGCTSKESSNLHKRGEYLVKKIHR